MANEVFTLARSVHISIKSLNLYRAPAVPFTEQNKLVPSVTSSIHYEIT